MDIQQGNVVTSKMLLQLRPGMTKSQVRYIMGTPLIVDSFHGNRWDYFYQLRQQGKVIEKRRVILDFDKELLTTVRGDVVAATDKSADTPVDTSARSVTTTKKPVEKPWFDMFKFWGSDEPAAAPEAAPATSSATTDLPAETAAVAAAAVASSAASPAPVGAEAATAAAAADIANEGAVETESILKKKPEMAGVDSVNLLPQAPEAQASVAAEATPEQIAPEALPQRAGEAVAATAVAAASGGEVGDAAQAIQATVNAWADAWRNKNVKAYFAAYADGFKPENGLSKSAWAAQRKQRLSGKRGDISLVLEDVAVTQHGNQASVQFFQKYASKVFSDEVTKQLDLQFDAATQRWLIVREFVVANGKRANEQKILAPEESSEHLDGVIEKIGF
ncbi:outer membrane protein assembly factor BamE [Methylotenera sp. 1P/1]|uniref:outer membrane protein assembly factor BamE domain-containing protein n=1 Tax=Methylotenera sp. 1P/1 TaxID=1131551 RepID=UPI001E4B31FF|nr:outer membrane protein assembly factor BamE [Methylotenera sp. 1P/1]